MKALVTSNEKTAPFQTYVEVMIFAAALGAKHKKRVPLTEFTKNLEPIRRDYFSSNSCEFTINLLAFAETQDHKILADDEISDAQRINIFEEYANGGLEILHNELRGAVDYSERILLILNSERFKQEKQEEEFDLSKFLT